MSIQKYLDKIKNAIYGREVRGAIHDAIKQTYDDAAKGGDANMEVTLARGTYPNLNARLDANDSKLENTKQHIEIELTKKIDRVVFDSTSSEIVFYANGRIINSVDVSEAGNAQLVQDYIDSLVSEGVIEGVTLPNGSLGTLKLADKSVTNDKLAVSKVGKNLFNKSRVIPNHLLSMSTGEVFENESYYTSDYMVVKPSTMYSRRYQCRVIFYDENYTFITGLGEENPSGELGILGTPVESPPNAKYARISFRNASQEMLERFQFEEGSTITNPEPHYHELKNTVATDRSRLVANNVSFEYNENGDLREVVEGHVTTRLHYADGDISHIIIVDDEYRATKRIDFIYENGDLKEVNERFV